MTPWQWWATSEAARSDGEWEFGDFGTREEAIAAANRELEPAEPFFVIEARSSTAAKYHDGSHDIVPFVRTRNEERFVARPRLAA